MKILALRLKNLNSLYGTWEIDFTHPEYLCNGIFSLTGPTGAGKSTILDAICLALYGATPRLGKITKSNNEIMSRQTGECYAEVVFETQKGRYLCHWEQRRAKKDPHRKLQDQEHQIVDAISHRPIQTKKSLVIGEVEKKTGMDFHRFTRSILLAQGHFDSFLKADIDQKASILEHITGREIYSKISQHTHQRQRDEQDKLQLLKTAVAGIRLLGEEDENAKHQELEQLEQKKIHLNAQIANINTAIQWHTQLSTLQQEIETLTEEKRQLEKEITAFSPYQEQLIQAQQAQQLETLYAQLINLRQHDLQEKSELQTRQAALSEINTTWQEKKQALIYRQQVTQQAKQEQKASQAIIQTVRSLDQQLSDLSQSIKKITNQYQQDKAQIKENSRKLSQHQYTHSKIKTTQHEIDNYLHTHSEDEWLSKHLAIIEEQLKFLTAKGKDLLEKDQVLANQQIEWQKICHRAEKNHTNYLHYQDALKQASNTLEQGKNSLKQLLNGRLLREYRSDKDHLLSEKNYLEKIAKLEEERKKLKDKQPCPLCGALTHPYAVGNIPQPDQIDNKIAALNTFIHQAEELEKRYQQYLAAEIAAQKELLDSKNQQEILQNDKKNLQQSIDTTTAELNRLQSQYHDLKQDLLRLLQVVAIEDISQPEQLLTELKARLHRWQQYYDQSVQIKQQQIELENTIQPLNAIIETQTEALHKQHSYLQTLQQNYDDKKKKRQHLYGNKQPDEEAQRLYQAVLDAEKEEKTAQLSYDEQEKRLHSANDQINALLQHIAQRQPGLEEKEKHFAIQLTKQGFDTEKVFCQARLNFEQYHMLSAQAQQLQDKQKDILSREKDRIARLATEKAKNISQDPLDVLQQQYAENHILLTETDNKIALLIHQLEENTQAKSHIKEKWIAIDKQNKILQRWDQLYHLIGSADGKKYRTFAQGITFELMVQHANQQLNKMTDRYQLIRSTTQALELNVIDNYQAGEIRSTKNLSGGENFIISLSLALGLSQMASEKVQVNSLFLDEGFGSLDEDSLETALQTLSMLHQNGKLIGVISHVSALKERISTQITIIPTSGGRSKLKGPGIT